jgi:hypothetical protein
MDFIAKKWLKITLETSEIWTTPETSVFLADVKVADPQSRTDCSFVLVPKDVVGFVSGNKGTALRNIEDRTGEIKTTLKTSEV